MLHYANLQSVWMRINLPHPDTNKNYKFCIPHYSTHNYVKWCDLKMTCMTWKDIMTHKISFTHSHIELYNTKHS